MSHPLWQPEARQHKRTKDAASDVCLNCCFSCLCCCCCHHRSVPKPVSAKICGFLRKSAVFCANLRLPNPLIYRAIRKSSKICKNQRKCAFRVRFLPFAVSLLARPDITRFKNGWRRATWRTNGGWCEEILPMPEIQPSVFYLLLRRRGALLGNIFCCSRQPPPANPFFFEPLIGVGAARKLSQSVETYS